MKKYILISFVFILSSIFIPSLSFAQYNPMGITGGVTSSSLVSGLKMYFVNATTGEKITSASPLDQVKIKVEDSSLFSNGGPLYTWICNAPGNSILIARPSVNASVGSFQVGTDPQLFSWTVPKDRADAKYCTCINSEKGSNVGKMFQGDCIDVPIKRTGMIQTYFKDYKAGGRTIITHANVFQVVEAFIVNGNYLGEVAGIATLKKISGNGVDVPLGSYTDDSSSKEYSLGRFIVPDSSIVGKYCLKIRPYSNGGGVGPFDSTGVPRPDYDGACLDTGASGHDTPKVYFADANGNELEERELMVTASCVAETTVKLVAEGFHTTPTTATNFFIREIGDTQNYGLELPTFSGPDSLGRYTAIFTIPKQLHQSIKVAGGSYKFEFYQTDTKVSNYYFTPEDVSMFAPMCILNRGSTSLPNCSSVSGYSLIKGQSCSVLVNTNTVFNFKAKDPDGGNLSWFIDWGDNKGLSKSCPSFYPNTTFSSSHAWTTAGTYNVKLGVSNCKVGGDASASFNIVVKNPDAVPTPTPTPANPSADVTDIVVSPQQNIPDKFLWTNAIWFPLKFVVNGTAIPDFTYSMSYADGQYTQPSLFPAPFSWQPGERTLNVGFSTNKCGPHNIKITLNSDKKIPEKNYSNNTFEKTLNIDCTTPPYNFDLAIEKDGAWPTTATQGTWITLKIKLSNKGTEEDPRYALLYTGYSKDPTIPAHGDICLYRTDSTGVQKIIQCPAGASRYVMDRPACGNNHYVMKVDAYNDLIETNENNNEVTGDVFVSCN